MPDLFSFVILPYYIFIKIIPNDILSESLLLIHLASKNKELYYARLRNQTKLLEGTDLLDHKKEFFDWSDMVEGEGFEPS